MQHKSSSSHDTSVSFGDAIESLLPKRFVGSLFNLCGPLKRRPPRLKPWQLLHSLVFHFLQPVGTLAQHVKQYTGRKISDSALSQRRAAIPWQLFECLVESCLKLKARARSHPQAFYKGLRLVGVDGTCFSVTNTPQNCAGFSKAASRRMKAAFAKVRACVMVELGLRNPIAAAIGPNEESEMALSRRLIEHLPEKSLSIWDRLYGVGAFIGEILAVHSGGKREFLMRVKANLKARLLKKLPDGSALVSIKAGGKDVIVREIRGRVRRPGGKWSQVRLWTSLPDAGKYPAGEMLELYGRRWESEIYYKELKIDMRGGDVLRSHTPLTAAQEIAAWILAHAVLVDTRIKAAGEAGEAVLRISFAQTLYWTRGFWQFLEVGAGILEPDQIERIARQVIKQIAAAITPKRRARSSPRALRKPVASWPRLLENSYTLGPTEYELDAV
ncbi:MAG TPA: IS4 family transposase, partial [Anaerolineales bacterium]